MNPFLLNFLPLLQNIKEKDKVDLNWVTKTEVDNYGFYVERRINEGEWEQHNICRRTRQFKLTKAIQLQ